MSYRVHPMLQRRRRRGNSRSPQDNNGRVTEREDKADRHRALPFLHLLPGHIIDRRDMVGIHGMPKPKAVGKKGSAHQSGIVTERNNRPHPREQIEDKQYGVDSANLPASAAGDVVEPYLNSAWHASILVKTLSKP